jgi:hypothetical protein
MIAIPSSWHLKSGVVPYALSDIVDNNSTVCIAVVHGCQTLFEGYLEDQLKRIRLVSCDGRNKKVLIQKLEGGVHSTPTEVQSRIIEYANTMSSLRPG